jgi:hypothetical protein
MGRGRLERIPSSLAKGVAQDHEPAPDYGGSRISSKEPKQAHLCERGTLRSQNQTLQKTEVETSSFCSS